LPLEFPTFPQAIGKKEKEPKRKKAATAVPLIFFLLPFRESNYKGNTLASNSFTPSMTADELQASTSPAVIDRRYSIRKPHAIIRFR
jgi:hypothetical protein